MSATAGAGGRSERRDLVARTSRDRLARWLELHPASLSALDHAPLQALTALLETARLSTGRARHINRELTDLKTTARELEEMARRDVLTGMANRRVIEERLAAEWERAVRYRRPLTVFIADVDHLKQVNDAFGHPAGDQLLREVAGRLKAVLRTVDTFGRIGGDEFVALCPETGEDSAAKVGPKLVAAASATPVRYGDHEFTVSLSVGWAVTGDEPRSEDLMSRADDALYRAKTSRGRARGFTPT
jgi:diguanylate cyclase (GGDEF)-like protein